MKRDIKKPKKVDNREKIAQIEQEELNKNFNNREKNLQESIPINSQADDINNNNNIEENESPKNEDNQQLEIMSKEDIRQYTNLIFLNMAKFSQKENDYFISQKAISKMLKDNKIISDKGLKQSQCDIIFKSISPKALKLSSQQFLTFLIKLAEKVYPNEFKSKPKDTINFFMQNLFQNYNEILNKEKIPLESVSDPSCQYKTIETLLTYRPNEKQIYLISKVLYTINEIYIKYFTFELESSVNLPRKSVKNLMEFSRDFELLPYIINETQLVTYYHLSINNNDNNPQIINHNIGESFTLNNFCLFLIQFSLLSYQKFIQGANINIKDSEVSKLIMFFEKLEMSKGMKTFSRKLNRPSAKKLSFLPKREVFLELGEIKEKESLITLNNVNNGNNSSLYGGKKDKGNKRINVNMEIIKNNLDDIERTFFYFGRIGDKLNFYQMSMSSYIKFLKHCALLIEISPEDKKVFNSISQNILNKTKIKNQTNTGWNGNQENLTEKEVNYKKKIAQIVNSSYLNDSTKKGLVQNKLSESDVNVIFSQLTGPRNFNNSQFTKTQFNKNKGYCNAIGGDSKRNININSDSQNDNKMLRMNFHTFLKSFEVIAERLYPNMNKKNALKKVIIENILPNVIKENNTNECKMSVSFNYNREINNNILNYSEIENVYEKICMNNEIKMFLNKLSVSTDMFYEHYCDDRTTLIDFNGMFEFYKNFSLFPEMVNLIQLKNIYSFLLSVNYKKEENSSNREIKNKSFITFSDFLYSLGITALLFDSDNNFNDIDKLLHLVERMNQSEGVKKCQMKIGRTYSKSKDFVAFLIEMKKNYPEFYKDKSQTFSREYKKNINNKTMSLDEIYRDGEEEYEEENE